MSPTLGTIDELPEEYLDKLDLRSNEIEDYWILYDRIFEPNSPLTY